MALAIGAEAPGFTLPSRPGTHVSLDDYRGRPVVLFFIPLAFSGVCTRQTCTLVEDYSSYSELGAEVIAITSDSPFVTDRFARECNASFPILSDFNRDMARAYDVAIPELFGMRDVSERAAFVIDADGVIRYVWVGEDLDAFPPLDEIRAAVAEIAQRAA